MKTKQELINFYKETGRVNLVRKDDMYDFLKEYFVSDLKKTAKKSEFEELFLKYLSADTLELYCKNLKNFGLAQKDVAKLLMCRAKTISSLLKPKAEVPFQGNRGYYLVYDLFDILAFCESKEYKNIQEKEYKSYQKTKAKQAKKRQLHLEREERKKQKQEEKIAFQNKILNTLPSSFTELYPKARSVTRKFIIHIGPTNSGKTYEALQRFRNANRGIYLAPLRLLASEVYFDTNEQGIPCHLITGEEAIMTPNATHQASTIEMASINEEYDVAVIDEAQLLSDKYRGGAWTRAILGVCAKEIHVCASPDSLYALKELITRCNDHYKIVKHERKTKLVWDSEKFRFPLNVKPSDAYIVFSKRAVLYCAAELEKQGFKTSIIYGSLPYSVRENEMKRFINGETQVVVSTDAIGMGLNLPIKRIVFLENRKFDGEFVRGLKPREVQQIAGRAGRFGIFNKGLVNAEYDKNYIHKQLDAPVSEFDKVYLNFPETLLSIDGKLSQIIRQWNRMNVDTFFIHFKMDLTLCLFVESLTDDKELVYKFLTIPFDCKNADLLSLWKHLVRVKVNESTIDINEQLKLLFPVTSTKEENLDTLELNYKTYDLLYAFMYKFGYTKYIQETMKNRGEISKQIIKVLKEKPLPTKECSVCKKPLPWNYPHKMCDDCYYEERYKHRGYFDFY